MAIKSIITLDIAADTGIITYSNPEPFSIITYQNMQFTFKAREAFTLYKEDILLYFKYLKQFHNMLLANIPSLSATVNKAVPVSDYRVQHHRNTDLFEYSQSSSTPPFNNIYDISYNPSTGAGDFARRNQDVTITPQEFLLGHTIITLFTNEVSVS